MKQRFRGHLAWIWIAPLFVLALIAAGCNVLPDTPVPETTDLEQTDPPPTVPELTAAPAAVEQPAASLTAIEITVKRIRENNSVVDLQKDDEVDVRVNDQIRVEEKGQGLLRFQDNLLVELLHGTELDLDNVRLEPGNSIFVRLQQILGTTRTELQNAARARVSYVTKHATIESADALDSATEFVICHAEAVTCMVTLAGEVEVEALGQVVRVPAGEATYVFPGEPPRPAICADMDEVENWLNQYRNAEEVQPLGKIVSEWPQQPCTTPAPSSESMVNIEAGLYEVGIPEADDFHGPPKQIDSAGFWIDQYEVANAQYQAFLDATGRPAPANWPAGALPVGREAHPVKGVAWDDAFAYCAWAYKRLPSESEWEIAARGPGSEPPLYPWGADPGAGGQVSNLPLSDTYEVGSMPFNRSPFDVYDQAGNVWEWVDEPYDPVEGGGNVLRGGRHGFLKDMAFRQPTEPNVESFIPFAGFRCAADHVDGE